MNNSLWNQKKHAIYIRKLLTPCLKLIALKNNEIEVHFLYTSYARFIKFFRNHSWCQYKQLVEIAVVDSPGKEYRFSVRFLFYSVRFQNRLRLYTEIDELTALPSLQAMYYSAAWLEREVWDLYGIFFIEHHDVRRILTDYGFLGHPLRKDFPLTGFEEIFYNESQKRITYEKVELAQEYRTYSIRNAWIK
jgi:NADH:ubiquinone oxidoreductase subunit C